MQIISLLMSGLVFLMWAFSMFRVLFSLRRRAVARTGKTWPGPIDTLHEWGIWLREPDYQRERRQLLLMTLAVFLLGYLFFLSATPNP